jgi:hypothetical protein
MFSFCSNLSAEQLQEALKRRDNLIVDGRYRPKREIQAQVHPSKRNEISPPVAFGLHLFQAGSATYWNGDGGTEVIPSRQGLSRFESRLTDRIQAVAQRTGGSQ